MKHPINKFTTQLCQSPSVQKLLFISIGNPSPKYDATRHSAGHLALEYFSQQIGGINHLQKFSNQSFDLAPLANHPNVYLMKSHEYMNNSGKAVRAALRKLGDCTWIVVHDDIDTVAGTAKFKLESRKMGAHNGLSSIAKQGLPFPRIRIGIGSPATRDPGAVASYVLSKYTVQDRALLENDAIPAGFEYFKAIINSFEQSAKRRYKKQKQAEKTINQNESLEHLNE